MNWILGVVAVLVVMVTTVVTPLWASALMVILGIVCMRFAFPQEGRLWGTVSMLGFVLIVLGGASGLLNLARSLPGHDCSIEVSRSGASRAC